MHCLYKLRFIAPVHFGAERPGIGLEKSQLHCYADTFFSALCQEIAAWYGAARLQEFVQAAQDGKFLLSDLLPYVGDELYVPKPVYRLVREDNDEMEVPNGGKKKMKKIKFIPVTELAEYLRSGQADAQEFAVEIMYDKTQILRQPETKPNGKPKHTELFSVSTHRFKENCGLYFIVELPEEQKAWFDNLLKLLGLTGIGGEVSSGYGKFEFATGQNLMSEIGSSAEKELAVRLTNNTAARYMMLSCFFPRDEAEIAILQDKESRYVLIPRGGFVSSPAYADTPTKKKPIVMVKAGSCLAGKVEGGIVDVSDRGAHPVWRYGKPMLLALGDK
ncbi:CRISPR-associated protein Csm4 [Candidatus Termititenax persephonae]|uniref:CRISPR system Cms protein Csm4 n=1 Tax=Candidatus Termititenax persephonae TaxID=2218525 RepID=A0A388TGU2_9BACT|nr:CRISPR-associated protein Csm4 [Candidatus Termititenax persephonae]